MSDNRENNPYESPQFADRASADALWRREKEGDPEHVISGYHFLLLVACAVATCACAFVNIAQEGGGVVGCFIGAIVSTASQVVGLFYLSRSPRRSLTVLVRLVVIYVSAASALFVHFRYACHIEAESGSSDASHMHVVAFPMLHVILSLMLWFSGELLSFALRRIKKMFH